LGRSPRGSTVERLASHPRAGQRLDAPPADRVRV